MNLRLCSICLPHSGPSGTQPYSLSERLGPPQRFAYTGGVDSGLECCRPEPPDTFVASVSAMQGCALIGADSGEVAESHALCYARI